MSKSHFLRRHLAMRLLKDDELHAALVVGGQLINIPAPRDWDERDSPVQPASIDLHVGDIHLPQKQQNEAGGLRRPLAQHPLSPGETVIVTTAEEMRLASNIAGFGFPPSHVSFQGILMTNPGHIDPGYAGRLRFAVINMGSHIFSLRRGDAIVTVLFVQLAGPARRDWLARHDGAPAPGLVQDDLDRLSADFLDIDTRARAIAKNAVTTAALRGPIVSSISSAIIASIVAIAIAFFSPSWKDPI